jgi:uncharacterized protein YndB with AHSA1/START domain
MAASNDVETVERVIPASADKIFDLLADPSRHRDFDGSGSVGAANDGAERLALGSKFGIAMKQGVSYSIVNEVVEFDENRRIAWEPHSTSSIFEKLTGGRIWRYELEPVDGGTRVRESWDVSQEKGKALLRLSRKRVHTSMEQTLARIEELVAS